MGLQKKILKQKYLRFEDCSVRLSPIFNPEISFAISFDKWISPLYVMDFIVAAFSADAATKLKKKIFFINFCLKLSNFCHTIINTFNIQ